MPIYDFASRFIVDHEPRGIHGLDEDQPHVDLNPPGVEQSSHVEGGRTDIAWGEPTVPGDIEEFIQPGFRYLDEAMLHYWSDIRIPTKDSYRFIKTRVAGGDKSLQVWLDDLEHGRVQLPVMSINRKSHDHNISKFSPSYLPLHCQFANTSRDMVKRQFRPVPFNVSYELLLWSEYKRDIEHALYQIVSRFNPLAVMSVNDNRWRELVEMHYGGAVDNSDKSAAAEDQRKIKYTISYTAEAWLSLPAELLPSILGTVDTGDENSVISFTGI